MLGYIGEVNSARTSHTYYLFFTSVTNPDLTPIIAGAPSVQLCLNFWQLRLLASEKESTRALTSAAVVVADHAVLHQQRLLQHWMVLKKIQSRKLKVGLEFIQPISVCL